MEEKRIPPIPVLIDSPIADQVTGIYRRYLDCYDNETNTKIASGDLPLEFRGLSFAMTPAQSHAIRDIRPPLIIVAGSGMCNGGRILKYIKNFAENQSTTIMFVGWQGASTPVQKFIDGERHVTIEGKKLFIKAHIETLNRFSAHADQKELLYWAKLIPGPPGLWFVNHGEREQVCVLAQLLEKEIGGRAIAAAMETYEV